MQLSFIRKTVNTKFSLLDRLYKNRPFTLLDVGAGNHSASRTVKLFPNCRYHGLDLNRNYANGEADFKAMTAFYELDLTELDYSAIPDNHFDCILMAHVIEHLHNGDAVLPRLLTKLKAGGYFYVEYPGKKSAKLPSMPGTLNFYDDPTHVRIYSIVELEAIFKEHNCTVLRSGTRRNPYYIASTPLRILSSLLGKGRLRGNIFWDLLGFAEYILVRKNNC